MSYLDAVDYDLLRRDKKQAQTDAKFEEFKEKADELIADTAFYLSELKSEYKEYVSYDDLHEYVQEVIADEFEIRSRKMSATIALQIIETEIENLRKENEALKDENAKLTKERDKYLLLYGKELMGNIDFQEKLAEKDKEISKLKREIKLLKETTKDLKVKDVGDVVIILKGKRDVSDNTPS